MSDDAAVVSGLILRRGATERCTYSSEAKHALLQLCSRPRVSVAGLALAHGINANLLRKWMLQDAQPAQGSPPQADRSKSAVRLLPVSVGSESKVSADSSEPCIEIVWGTTTLVLLRGSVEQCLRRSRVRFPRTTW